MIAILLMYAFLAITFIASKDLLAVIDPLLIIVIRMAACSILFSIYVLATTSIKKLSTAYLGSMFVLGFFNVYAANALQIAGLEYIDPVNASLWYNSTPFIIALLDFLVYRKKISTIKVFSLLLGWLAFVPLALGQQISSPFYAYGVLCFLLSACSMAISGLMLEKHTIVGMYPPSLTNALSLAIGALFAFIHYHFLSCNAPTLSLSGYNYLMLMLVIFATIICASLYIYFVKKHSALLVTFAGFSLPLFSLFFELVLGKTVQITNAMIFSGILITIALFLFAYKKY